MNAGSDLDVAPVSTALAGLTLDVVVSGSIGAVESVRLIRALRRLGAEVQPHLTRGGARFVTPMALSWAAGRRCITGFRGDATHIATSAGVVVAPASTSFIAKLATGLSEGPAAALVLSHLGAGQCVLLLPNAHDSLLDAPAAQRNLEQLTADGVRVLAPRIDEGKRKFPDPQTLADECAHTINRARYFGRDGSLPRVLVSMGTTRGYIDAVRYISNYSSGALGSAISEELYRLGCATDVVCGPCPIKPRVASRMRPVETTEAMQAACLEAISDGAEAAIFAASVLDYAPEKQTSGKISSQAAELTVVCKPTAKIIAAVNPQSGIKVGFKLEVGLDSVKAEQLAKRYFERYGLSLMVLNDLDDVDASRHRAFLAEAGKGSAAPQLTTVDGKQLLAARIAAHVHQRLVQTHKKS